MHATSRQGIYAGIRDGVNGWLVIYLSHPLQASVVSNMILDPDPSHRPLTLAKHDFYNPEGSSLPVPCKEWNKQIRCLFAMPGGQDDDTMMILSPLTGAPVAAVPALSITDDLLHFTPSEAVEYVEDFHLPAAAAGSSAPAAPPLGPVGDVLAPGTPLTPSDRRALRHIPVDTPIVVEQDNPKKGMSFDRYEAYKG